MIPVILVLVIVAVLVNAYVPMTPPVKTVFNIIIVALILASLVGGGGLCGQRFWSLGR